MIGILTDPDTGDLLVEKGRLVIGDNTNQVAEFVLRANRGEFKELPLIGTEVVRLQNGIVDPMWCGDTKNMLQACGVPASKVSVNGSEIIVE